MKRWVLGLLLAVLTLVVYAQVRNHEYLSYDDDNYIVENMGVNQGLTLGTLWWTDATTHDGLRIPLTWLSYWLDATLWGLEPGAVLLSNVAYHTFAGLLLLWALVAATGSHYRSAFVVAVFLLHPIHVESVAWASERKDVLCALMWNATLVAYVRYARGPSLPRYLLVLLFHSLALAAKPMAVSLPGVLLLLDLWPLDRLGPKRFEWLRLRRALLEKLPLAALSGVAMVVAYGAQQADNAMRDLATIPLLDRIGNACLSYVAYIDKALWPSALSVFYPYPEEIGIAALVAALGLLAATLTSLRLLWRAPYVAVGWLWFLGTLVPVIGLVQVGLQAMANRYAYLPLVGLTLTIAWGTDAIAQRFCVRRALVGVALVVTLAMAILAHREVAHWHDSVSLFRHALAADPNNGTARANLGIALLRAGEVDAGTEELAKALGIQFDGVARTAAVHNVLLAQAREGLRQRNPAFAVALVRTAVVLAPDSIPAHGTLARALFLQRRYDEAIEHFEKARLSDDKLAVLHGRAAEALEAQGRPDEAVKHYAQAVTRAERGIARHDARGGVPSAVRTLQEQRSHWASRIQALGSTRER